MMKTAMAISPMMKNVLSVATAGSPGCRPSRRGSTSLTPAAPTPKAVHPPWTSTFRPRAGPVRPAQPQPQHAHRGRRPAGRGGRIRRAEGVRGQRQRRTRAASTSSCPGGQSLRAYYLVGCDGGRSLVRKAAGFEFPGWEPSTSSLVAEVEMREEPEWGIRYDTTALKP